MTPSRYLLAFAGLTVSLFLAVNGVMLFLEKNSPGGAENDSFSTGTVEPAPPGGSETGIREPAISDPRLIRYTGDGFVPRSVSIQARDLMQCLITIRNETKRMLRVGVSPHDPAGDPGSNYGEIAPGEAAILDPRYPGLDEVTMHDHVLPARELRIFYGIGCR